MFCVNILRVRPITSAEVNLKVQKHLFSRQSNADIKFWWVRNDFHARISVLVKNFYSQSSSLKSSMNIKQHSTKILKSWSRQFEFVLADRLRKSLQLITMYNKWWGYPVHNLFYQRFTAELSKFRKFYFIACLAPVFQWDKNRITDEELLKLEADIDNVKKLCLVGNIDESQTSTDFASLKSDCECNRCRHLSYDGWTRLYTDPNCKIWRKEHVDHPGEGLYVYKVYGCFSDVTANDFFRVQVDVDYRKQWDSNSVELNIVESDTITNSDILYWEFLFPRMFYNRDYVCNRRFSINPSKKTFIIACENIDHPDCPEKPPIHRVKEYWSHTVIRSTANSPDEPGVEFTITYFDNPEVQIPNYVTIWYTVSGMPEYIYQQKKVALRLADIRKRIEKENLSPSPAKEVVPETKNKKEKQQTQEKRFMLL